jgi:hypothetical protein
MIWHRFVRWLESILYRALYDLFLYLHHTHDRLEQRQFQASIQQSLDELAEQFGVDL